MRKKSGEYQPDADAIQVMTMKVSKGLEFPVVALPGVVHMPTVGRMRRTRRGCLSGATRATQRLLLATSGASGFGNRLGL